MSQRNAENRSQIATLDVLIEQSRSLFAIYDARRSTAETKIAGVVTAAVAVATITVTAATPATGTTQAEKTWASIVLALVVASVLCALLARSLFGLQLGEKKGPFLSSESNASRDWQCALRDCPSDASPAHAKELALAMWRARESDSHDMARAKERGAGAAGVLLGLALVCDGILGYLLIQGAG